MQSPRLMRTILIMILTLLSLSFANAQDVLRPTDPGSNPATDQIADNLARAKSEHQQSVDDASKVLLDTINRRINTAADAGDLATVQSLQKAKAIANSNAMDPIDTTDSAVTVAKNHFDSVIAASRSRLIAAYQNAIRGYTRARRFDKAESVQTEFNSITSTDPTMAPHVVDLMRLLDLRKDVVSGTWHLTEGVLSNEIYNGPPGAQVRFPYTPPAEYDFHIIYARQNGHYGLALGVYRIDAGTFGCSLPSGDQGDVVSFMGLKGLNSVRFPTPPGAMDHGDVRIQVRNDRLVVIVNGEKSVDREMKSWEFDSTPEFFKPPKKSGLGIIDWYGKLSIAKAEVVEISGPGTVVDEDQPK